MKTYKQFIKEAWNRKAQKHSKKNGLKPAKEKDGRPEAYVTVAVPGAGKSAIVKHMQANNPKVGHHELDKSRQALGKSPKHFGKDIMQHQQAGIESDAKKGNPVVVSNTSIPKAHRNAAISHLRQQGYNAKIITPPTSPRAARRRNRKRTGTSPGSSRVPGFVMKAMSRQYEKGINTNPRGGGALSRADRREARKNFKALHKRERFTKPAMRRSGAIR